MILNLPAIYLGAILTILLGISHIASGESALLACSAVFVPLIWYRAGKWIDDQTTFQSIGRMRLTWTWVARALVGMALLMLLLAFPVEWYREGEATKFAEVVATGWAGIYLAVGIWGDRRRDRIASS